MNSPELQLSYFDGRSARERGASIRLDLARRELLVQPQSDELRRYAMRSVHWPERQRHGQRQVLLPDGGVLSTSDAAAWDAWAAAAGLTESPTVRWMQSWRYVGVSLLLLVALLAAGWRWGAPLAAQGVVAMLPPGAERVVGEQTLQYLDEQELLKPSRLDAARRVQIEQNFAAAAQRALPLTGPQPAWRLHLRDGDKLLGPNAFALPGGDIVLTDSLAELLADSPDALVGVLGHELGHVQRRHGMRLVVQAGLVAAVAGLVVGDFSTLLAGVPAVLSQAAYSRDFEREADAYSRRLMQGAGIRPEVMALFFERVAKARDARQGLRLPIAIASHPADEERIRFFRDGN
ncbi:M48 family metallopeptidase [Paucibacter sp. R3-3]|uniref:M48 family metallopeptidase n=1 Tax=Roseateles agri TaxID=3098619 RepID=A0ABU5DDX2_9BURK|nr:M48 family metallopeptidase [Paucibacter sp. R3-3]MDY0744478.1 M48 family metallopeptidase [Paucibacter sp. R3-3]